jgi:hypothetical protein
VIPDFYVARLVFDPLNKNTAYIALGNFAGGTAANQSHVWRVTNLNTTPVITSRNGTGANVLPDVPVNGFAIDPLNGNSLYAGTDIGVYSSPDGGANWFPFGTGLPRVAVFDMAIQPTSRILRIATHGRGMWQIPIGPLTAANVSVSGRVLTSDGRGVRNAKVQITGADGTSWTVLTGPRGNYHFDEIPSGATYTVSVISRRFQFAPRTVTLNDSVSDMDFTPSTGGASTVKKKGLVPLDKTLLRRSGI